MTPDANAGAVEPRLELAPDWTIVVTQLTPAGQDVAAGRTGWIADQQDASPRRHTLAHVTIAHHRGLYAGLAWHGFTLAAPVTADGVDWPAARVTYPSRRYTAHAASWTALQLRPQVPGSLAADQAYHRIDQAIRAAVRVALEEAGRVAERTAERAAR